VLMCDRDASGARPCANASRRQAFAWSRHRFKLQIANASAEQFVRSIKEECLDRLIALGEPHFRRAVTEFVAHDHRERNNEGLKNTLIDAPPTVDAGRVHRQQRLGGLINYDRRAA
jgi:hypothetical protein